MKVIDCTQQLQVRENVVGFEKTLGAVKVIKDQIQYRSQSLLNLARGYFNSSITDKLLLSHLFILGIMGFWTRLCHGQNEVLFE